ncbi:uncharacterized protein LOC141655263 [Silene latifolia]|uniref:uncharacterized protein LOC141655263 n=1 Tax=Silene latifolia TaxID=37657 RepID=UPI003D787BC9
MHRHVFLRLEQAVEAYDTFFSPGPDGSGRVPISSLQKCTATLRMLAYGEEAVRTNEYCRLGESTTFVELEKFTEAVINAFGADYLRSPNATDLQRLLQIGAHRGLPGMMGSIDCMHWQWKNCPVGWRGMYQGRNGRATVILEAVASQDLWIWHSFFGIPGSCNDLTVLHRSPIFDDMINGRAPRVNYMVNGNHYNSGYYLTDGIYP